LYLFFVWKVKNDNVKRTKHFLVILKGLHKRVWLRQSKLNNANGRSAVGKVHFKETIRFMRFSNRNLKYCKFLLSQWKIWKSAMTNEFSIFIISYDFYCLWNLSTIRLIVALKLSGNSSQHKFSQKEFWSQKIVRVNKNECFQWNNHIFSQFKNKNLSVRRTILRKKWKTSLPIRMCIKFNMLITNQCLL
jgi:hypothetical protein